jgi:gliding motility-associated-like protein
MVRKSVLLASFLILQLVSAWGQGFYDYFGVARRIHSDTRFLKWNRQTERFDSVWLNHFSGSGPNANYSVPFADCSGELLYVSNPITGHVKNAMNGNFQNDTGFLIGYNAISIKIPNSNGEFLVLSKRILESRTEIVGVRINPFFNNRQGRVVVSPTVIDVSQQSDFFVLKHPHPDSIRLFYGGFRNPQVRTRLFSASMNIYDFQLTWHDSIMGRFETPYDFQHLVGVSKAGDVLLGAHYENSIIHNFLVQHDVQSGRFSNLITFRTNLFPFGQFGSSVEQHGTFFSVSRVVSNDTARLYSLDYSYWNVDSIMNRAQHLRSYFLLGGSNISFPNQPYYDNRILLFQQSARGVNAAQPAPIIFTVNGYIPQANGSIVYEDTLAQISWALPSGAHPIELMGQKLNPALLNWTQAPFVARDTCLGDSTVLSLSDSDFVDYAVWHFGDTTAGAINTGSGALVKHVYPNPGTYTVTLYIQYCGLYPDTLVQQITILGPPEPAQLPDTTLCVGSSLSLSVSPQASNSIRWSNGDSAWSTSLTTGGWQWAEISNACFSTRDSFYITLREPPQSGLLSDTNVCAGSSFTLTPQPGDYTWQWQDGSTQPLTVTEAGTFALLMTNACGTFVHEVRVDYQQAPELNLNDTSRCEGQFYRIELPEVWQGSYQWTDGSSERIRILTDSGWYSAEINNPCGSATDEFYLSLVDCECHMYLPTAFSPNGDGLNDELIIKTRCPLSSYQMEVYDRWGRQIFASTDLNRGWDGTFQGQDVPNGSYPFIIRYTPEGRNPRVEKGVVSVLR